AAASQAIQKLFDSTEKTGRFRLGYLRRQLFELRLYLALALCSILRRVHGYLNVHVSGLFRSQHRHSLACKAEPAAGLRAGGDLELNLAAINRRHFKFAAKRGARHRDRHTAIQVGAIALEEFVRSDLKKNIKVARRTAAQARLAFTGEPDTGTVFNTGRNIH